MKIAIKTHPNRGKEIISLLESLGGINANKWKGDGVLDTYYIDKDNIIIYDPAPIGYKMYTLEEFEKEFPFKIGDKVTTTGTSHPKIITGITDTQWGLRYVISEIKFPDSKEMPHISQISLYKEVKEERNITLTFEKAKEWYKKGGELKEVALQAYSEKELTKIELPKTWEEFCEKYPIQKGECWLGSRDTIQQAAYCGNRSFRNWIPSKQSAEAHLAMIQLEQLRDCYRGLFVTVTGMPVWCIIRHNGRLVISPRTWGMNETFLSFQAKEVAEEYLKNFKPLIEQAGDLI